MSSGKQLQEMEVGTKQSKGPVNANAGKGMPLESEPDGSTQVKLVAGKIWEVQLPITIKQMMILLS